MDIPIEELREQAKRVWAAGDYRKVGMLLEPAAQRLVEHAGVGAGHRVLDVGTGTGNVALAAARAGAEVVAVDIADTWFPTVQERAADAGVEVELRLGDAEELPLGDAGFDAVLSNFAAVFAPRHGFAAAELARVCKPGGVVALTAWPEDAPTFRVFAPLQRRAPEPPSYATPHHRWAEPAHAQAMFAAHGVDIEVEEAHLTFAFASPQEYEQQLIENSGVVVMTRAALDDPDAWDDVVAEMRAAIDEINEADDGSFRTTTPYRIVSGRRSTA